MPELSQTMAQFAREVAVENDRDAKMQRVVDSAVSVIASCSDAGLSALTGREHVETIAATSDRPRQGDQWQYELDQGPCLDAIWARAIVHSYDLADERRWPQWAPRVAAELGIRSMLCVRLYTRDDSSLGALNLYAETVDGFDQEERDQALVIAAHAAVALAASHEIDELHHGMQRRTVMGQATGVLMERYGLDPTAAFEVLRRVSQAENRTVHDIATELVTQGSTEGL